MQIAEFIESRSLSSRLKILASLTATTLLLSMLAVSPSADAQLPVPIDVSMSSEGRISDGGIATFGLRVRNQTSFDVPIDIRNPVPANTTFHETRVVNSTAAGAPTYDAALNEISYSTVLTPGQLVDISLWVRTDRQSASSCIPIQNVATVDALGEEISVSRTTPLECTATCRGRDVTVNWRIGGGLTGDDGEVILGTPAAEALVGGDGDDLFCAGGGDDFIFGGRGDDIIWGGPGNDNASGNDGNDTIHGGLGDDQMSGNDGNDRIFGYQGNDRIEGGNGDDRLHGNAGEDNMHGGPGNDLMFGYGGNDDMVGNDGDDIMRGNRGNDLLSGLAGDDVLFGSAGDDRLSGGFGNDQLNGNSDNDFLIGPHGNNTLDGGIGVDECAAGSGVDTRTRCETQGSAPDIQPEPAPAVAAVSSFTQVVTAEADLSLIVLYDAPAGSIFTPDFNGIALPAFNPNVFDIPRTFRVVEGGPNDAWVRVQVVGSPNGTTGWIRNESLAWTTSNSLVQLDLSASTISVFEGTQLIQTSGLRHGRPSAPTPTGDGWIEYVLDLSPTQSIVSFGMIVDTQLPGGALPMLGLRGSDSGAVGPTTSQGGVFTSHEMFDLIRELPAGSRVHIMD